MEFRQKALLNGKTLWLGLLKEQKEDQAPEVEWRRRVVGDEGRRVSKPRPVHIQLYREHRFYPKVNQELLKSFKRNDMIRFTFYKINQAAM